MVKKIKFGETSLVIKSNITKKMAEENGSSTLLVSKMFCYWRFFPHKDIKKKTGTWPIHDTVNETNHTCINFFNTGTRSAGGEDGGASLDNKMEDNPYYYL